MRYFLTGGAGFLGKAIMRRAALFSPDPIQFTIYSRDEAKQAVARAEFPDATYVLGDVRDRDRLQLAMVGHDVVIHCAAMKYVPQAESNVWEVMSVNIDGSRNVVQAAAANRVQHVVGISTDKACRPVNVYGLTKLVMERLFQEADDWGTPTRFHLVRYGNVVASTGSVIPLFRRQAREGVITLTNPDMTRFWLSVEDAVGLIKRALHEPSGTVLIPRLRSATMQAVAEAAYRLENYKGAFIEAFSEQDPPEFKVIGERFGEKVHEDLLGPQERIYAEACVEVIRLWPVSKGPFYGTAADGSPKIADAVFDGYRSDNPTGGLLSPTDMLGMIIEARE